MTLRECYTAMGGDYAEVSGRLKKEEMIFRFVRMFAQEDMLSKLKNAMASGDVQAAFRAAHSLKGNCMSLGFTSLLKTAGAVMEPLRNGDLAGAAEQLEPLEREYERSVNLIVQLGA